MNSETEALLDKVSQQVQKAIWNRDCPAVVAIQGERTMVLSDYDYLRDDQTAAAFEHRAAEQAQQIDAVRWVFAVPQVWVLTEDGAAARAVSNLPLREGEREAITWTACDVNDGVDYGIVPYTRRPSGAPVFDDPEIFTVAVQPGKRAPGWIMLRTLMPGDADGDG